MVDAILHMGSHPHAEGEILNFGSGSDISVIEIAEKIIAISGYDLTPIHVEPRRSEVTRLTCNPSKAQRLFGWSARVPIDEGLLRNYEWMEQMPK